MLFIFSDSFFPPVLSGSWINTNKKIYEILKPVQKENVMHNTEEEPQISQASAKTAWALPTWIKKNKKKTQSISANTKGSWHFRQNRVSANWKKETGGNPESGFNQKLKPEHVSLGPWLSAMRAKQTLRPGLTTSASVRLQWLLWKPWTLRTQQKHAERAKLRSNAEEWDM